MKLSLDLKSLAIGLLLGLCVMFARGAANNTSTPNRYDISALQRPSDDGGQQTVVFVLDKQTGKVYGYTKTGNGGWEHPQTRSFVIKDSDME